MSLRNTKVGDKVVHYPYGIGKIDLDDNSSVPLRAKHENDIVSWNHRSGCYQGCLTPHIWPIDNAPGWVWPALGIEKPKRKVKIVVKRIEDVFTYDGEVAIGINVVFTSKPFLVDADVVDKIPGAWVVE